MKFTLLNALMLPLALLALGSVHNASAATCSTTYTLTAVTAIDFSCTIGNLTFSNFDYTFQAGVDTGCTGSCTPAGTPDPTANISVDFDLLNSGSDPYGTGASSTNPIIQVITTYSGGTTVNEFQNESGIVQYLVTATGGASVTNVDGAFTGFADTLDGASGNFNKNLCNNNQFEGGADPNGGCPSFLTNEQAAASGLPLHRRPLKRTARRIMRRSTIRALEWKISGLKTAELLILAVPRQSPLTKTTSRKRCPAPELRNPPLSFWSAARL